MVLTQPTAVSAIETEFGFSGNATKTDLGPLIGLTAGGTVSMSQFNGISAPTGGNITISGGNRIHTFTSSGTFTTPGTRVSIILTDDEEQTGRGRMNSVHSHLLLIFTGEFKRLVWTRGR
jgi:hypothetical protein